MTEPLRQASTSRYLQAIAQRQQLLPHQGKGIAIALLIATAIALL